MQLVDHFKNTVQLPFKQKIVAQHPALDHNLSYVVTPGCTLPAHLICGYNYYDSYFPIIHVLNFTYFISKRTAIP